MKATHKNLKRVNQDVYRGRQSWCYKAIWKYGDERLQVYIERDSYDFQSYVSVCIWSLREAGMVATSGASHQPRRVPADLVRLGEHHGG